MKKNIFCVFLSAALFIAAPAAALWAETVHPQKILQEAYRLIDQKEFDKALLLLDRVIGMNFKSAPAHYNRGMIFLNKNQTGPAIRDFDRALGIDPKFAPAYMAKAKFYFGREDWENALKELDKALGADRKFGQAYYNRALVWEKKNEFEKAFRDYKKARRYGAEVGERDLERVWILGHLDQILVKSSRAIQENPGSAEAFHDLGKAYYYKKDYTRALENLTKAKALGGRVDAQILKEVETHREE